MMIDKDANILETAQTGIQLAFTPPAPDSSATSTRTSREIAVFPEANYVAAVIRLRGFTDTFLYVARLLDPRVVAQLQADRGQRRRIRRRSNRASSASRSRSR